MREGRGRGEGCGVQNGVFLHTEGGQDAVDALFATDMRINPAA